MGFLWSTWWLVYLLLLRLRAVARGLAGHMLSFSSSLSSLMLLGLYSSHMLSGMSSATNIFQFSFLSFSFVVVWIYACRKEYDILITNNYWVWMFFFVSILLYVLMNGVPCKIASYPPCWCILCIVLGFPESMHCHKTTILQVLALFFFWSLAYCQTYSHDGFLLFMYTRTCWILLEV